MFTQMSTSFAFKIWDALSNYFNSYYVSSNFQESFRSHGPNYMMISIAITKLIYLFRKHFAIYLS